MTKYLVKDHEDNHRASCFCSVEAMGYAVEECMRTGEKTRVETEDGTWVCCVRPHSTCAFAYVVETAKD